MRRFLAIIVALGLPAQALAADAISRRDAFTLIWQSTGRPIETIRDTFDDVEKGTPGYEEISYAKSRDILGDVPNFRPDEPVTQRDALKWLFRTRSVEPFDWDHTQITVSLAEEEDVEPLAEQYGIDADFDANLSEKQLLDLMRNVDAALANETHEASLYSEKFHGKGTAFGESFNMYAMTAAHRSYPYNTLVRVTNLRNQKSVLVRINDRGPYVNGRDMDLSLAAFTSIEDRGYGKINATFERLGDINVVGACNSDRFQQHITRYTRLTKGVPHSMAFGKDLVLASKQPFVVRSVTYPDGFVSRIEDWILPGEQYLLKTAYEGEYRFLLGSAGGRNRAMSMNVVRCPGQAGE